MNLNLLEYHMAKKQDTKKELAKALDMSLQTLYRRLRTASFSFPEIKVITSRYNLTEAEFREIFLVNEFTFKQL